MGYSSTVFVLWSIACIASVIAAPHAVYFDAIYNSADSRVEFLVKIYPNDDTIATVAVVDSATGSAGGGCSYTVTALPTYDVGATRNDLRFWLDYTNPSAVVFRDTNGIDIGCPFLTGPNPDYYTVYVRVYDNTDSTINANTKDYEVKTFGFSTTDEQVIARTSLVGPETIDIDAKTGTISLSVVTNSDVVTTDVDLGDPVKLEFKLVVNDYVANLDVSGAIVKDCYVDYVSDFSQENLQIIGADGCWVDTSMFENMVLTNGFARDSSDSTVVGGTMTYVARSKPFEMSRFAGEDTLYFKCSISYCFITSGGAGTCYQDHCSSRKKREAVSSWKPDASVTATVNITRKDGDSCEKCTRSTTYVASLASLGSVMLITCGIMACTFVSAKHIGEMSGSDSKRSRSRSSHSSRGPPSRVSTASTYTT